MWMTHQLARTSDVQRMGALTNRSPLALHVQIDLLSTSSIPRSSMSLTFHTRLCVPSRSALNVPHWRLWMVGLGTRLQWANKFYTHSHTMKSQPFSQHTSDQRHQWSLMGIETQCVSIEASLPTKHCRCTIIPTYYIAPWHQLQPIVIYTHTTT